MGPCPRRIRITIKSVSSLYNPLMDWCDPAHCYSVKFNILSLAEKRWGFPGIVAKRGVEGCEETLDFKGVRQRARQ